MYRVYKANNLPEIVKWHKSILVAANKQFLDNGYICLNLLLASAGGLYNNHNVICILRKPVYFSPSCSLSAEMLTLITYELLTN